MPKVLIIVFLFVSVDLFAQASYSVFSENGKKGVKNNEGKTMILPEYADILIYEYFTSSSDTSKTKKLFIGIEEGEITERVHFDSTLCYNYGEELTEEKRIKRVPYKTVKNGILDIYDDSFNRMVDNAGDFAYLTVNDDAPSGNSGFVFYAISEAFSLGGFNYSFNYIDNKLPSLYKKNGKWGMIDKENSKITVPEFDSIERTYSPGGLFVYKNGKTGVALENGTIGIDPLYDKLYFAHLFSIADFYVVKQGTKYGAVKLGNKTIIPIEYNSVIPVNEKYIIVNREGEIVRKEERVKLPSYEYDDYMNSVSSDIYYDFKDSLIVGGKFGLFDSNGNLVIPEKYSYISVIGDVFQVIKGGKENTEIYTGSDGVFYYTYFPNEPGTTYRYSQYQHHENVSGGKRSYIDANGKKVFKGIDSLALVTTEIYYASAPSNYYYLKKGNKCGIADSLRNIIVPVKFETVYPLIAKDGEKEFSFFGVITNEFFGLYDHSGKELLPSKFNILTLASNNEANPYDVYYDYINYTLDSSLKEQKITESVFITGEGGKKQTIKNTYFDEMGLSDYEYEILKDVKYSLYDLEGNKITREFYDTLYTSYGSNLITARKFDKYGLLKMDGNNAVRCEYDQIIFQGNDKFVAYKDNVCGLIAENGILIPVEYDAISGLGKDLFRLTRGYQHGIYSLSKGMILPVEYDYLYKDYYQDYILMTQGEKYGMADGNGTILLSCTFDGIELQAYGFVPRISKISEAGSIGFYDKDKREIILEPTIHILRMLWRQVYANKKRRGTGL